MMITMRNKKQISQKFRDLKSVFRTKQVMAQYNPSLAKELEAEFIKMTENLRMDVIMSMNDKECIQIKNENERFWKVDIQGEYLEAYICYCDLHKILRGL